MRLAVRQSLSFARGVSRREMRVAAFGAGCFPPQLSSEAAASGPVPVVDTDSSRVDSLHMRCPSWQPTAFPEAIPQVLVLGQVEHVASWTTAGKAWGAAGLAPQTWRCMR